MPEKVNRVLSSIRSHRSPKVWLNWLRHCVLTLVPNSLTSSLFWEQEKGVVFEGFFTKESREKVLK